MKFHFNIFLKIVEFIYFKVEKLSNKKFNKVTELQINSLLLVLLSKTQKTNLTDKEQKQYDLFLFKVFKTIIRIGDDSNKFIERIDEHNGLIIFETFKVLINTRIFSDNLKMIKVADLIGLLFKVSLKYPGEIRNMVNSFVIELVNRFWDYLEEEKESNMSIKLYIMYMIEKDEKEAVNIISAVKNTRLHSLLYLNKDVKEIKTMPSLQLILASYDFNFLRNYSEEEKEKNYVELIETLLTKEEDNNSKTKVSFLIRILSNNLFDNATKLKIFNKLFKVELTNNKIIFDGLYKFIKGNMNHSLFDKEDFLCDFIIYLTSKIDSKVNYRLIIKSIFLLLINIIKREANMNEFWKQINISLSNSQINQDSMGSFVSILFDKIDQLKESKGIGLFFICLVDLNKRVKEIKSNVLGTITPTIVDRIMNRLGKDILLDSFILKAILIDKEIISLIKNKETIEKLSEFLLSKNSPLNMRDDQNFSNNFIKQRNKIFMLLFEVKTLYLRYLLKNPQYKIVLREYVKEIGDYLDELYDFLRLSCDCLFTDFDEETAKPIKRDKIQVKEDSYKRIDIFLNQFKKGKLNR